MNSSTGDGGGAVTRLALPRFPGLSVAEGDGPTVEGCDAAVRDGDPVGVAGEVAEDLLWFPKGALRVDHPVLATSSGEGGLELAGIGEMGDVAVEGDLALAIRAGEVFEEAAAEQAGEDLDGGQERTASDPPLAVADIEAGVGHDHMQMGVEQQLLVPGMEDGGAADP